MDLRKALSRFLLVDLLKGLRVTFKQQAPAEIITEQYPKVRPEVSERFRGAPRLNLDPDTGETLCIACNLCALACPENCIEVGWENREVTAGGRTGQKRKVLTTFLFDTSRCLFCNLCAEACPTNCLELTQEFELASYSRKGFIWDREMLEHGRVIKKYKR
jgi:NADH-quinone oxidoreductase subunit I